MSAKILEGTVGKVADRWLPNILGSPLLFWLGVFLLHVYSLDDDWDTFVGWFGKLPETSQFIAIGLALSLVLVSDFAIQQLELPVLRHLEGYWPHWLVPKGRRQLIEKFDRQQKDALQTLGAIQLRSLQNKSTEDDTTQRLKLERQLSLLPVNLEGAPINPYLMPTRLGNILRTYERKPTEKYGLDAVACWPRLWLLLPDPVKLDLSAARSDLNASVRLWIWSFLFIFVGWRYWPAIPIGLAVSLWTQYVWMHSAAQTYGILLEAAFDTHRHLLYEALRLPLPATPDAEFDCGQQLTNYLRGTKFPKIDFTSPSE